MVFLVEFEKVLYFQGFNGVFGGMLVIFGDVKSGEMLNSSMFCRSGYRSDVLWFVWMKCLGNADFIRGLWIEQICRSWLPAACSKM